MDYDINEATVLLSNRRLEIMLHDGSFEQLGAPSSGPSTWTYVNGPSTEQSRQAGYISPDTLTIHGDTSIFNQLGNQVHTDLAITGL